MGPCRALQFPFPAADRVQELIPEDVKWSSLDIEQGFSCDDIEIYRYVMVFLEHTGITWNPKKAIQSLK